MRTAELTGALLDYWVARAEGVPADDLRIDSLNPRETTKHCYRASQRPLARNLDRATWVLDYSTDWAHGGPLLEKWCYSVEDRVSGWAADPKLDGPAEDYFIGGDTPLQAICRAVVRAAFGDEVEDVAC